MVKTAFSFFLILITYLCDVYAQISEAGTPESFQVTLKSAPIIPEYLLNAIDTSYLLADEIAQGIPNRYGVVQQMDIDIKKDGIKTEITGKGYIWQYKIQSPLAYSLGIHFAQYLLPAGAKVFIYNETRTKIAGAFTSNNNNSANQLAIAEFKGQNAIIEYFEPLEPTFSGELMIGSVSQAYKDVMKATQTRIGINCTEGANWQDAKHAVCRMTFHDTQYAYYCTGFLVNNVKEDGTPYFQTANHCLSTNSMATTLVTYFNYENSTCTNSDAQTTQTLSGATLKATNSYSDFSLLLLNEYPPSQYYPYYAGWDVITRAPQSGTCIHHPQGTPKCIALDSNAPTSYPYALTWKDENNVVTSTTAANTHWNVVFDDGGIESGSSGSPLFDDNQRVIGQLHGGSATNTYYGKFSLSWNYSSANTKQLQHWLDPNNSGTLTLNGIYTTLKPQASFSTKITRVCVGAPVVFTDQTKYSPKQWNWKIEPTGYAFVSGTDSSSQNPAIEFNSQGNYTISLIVKNSNGADSITKTNYISAGDIQVELTGVPADSVICGCNLVTYPLSASGAMNYNFALERTDKIDYTINSNNIYLSLKSAEKKNGSFNSWVKVTGTFGKCVVSDSIQMKVIVPPNDDIENAVRLQPGINAPYSNFCASVETHEPHPSLLGCYSDNSWCSTGSSSDSILKNTIWFTFLGPTNGKITIDTHGFNDRITIYDATTYSDILSGKSSSYTILAANDDRSSTDATAEIQNLAVEPYKKYWLQVDGYNGATGNCTIALISNSLEVFPNPSNGQFDIIISNADDGITELRILSQIGQLIYTNQLNVTKEANRFSLDLSMYASGMYILEVKINGTTSKAKLMIVK